MKSKIIHWKLHLQSSPEKVFMFLSTKEGREKFWAESANSKGAVINFEFINGMTYQSKILKSSRPNWFEIDYFTSTVRFELSKENEGGTILRLLVLGVSEEDYCEVHAGWVSVLLALKAAADYSVDLRNHDKRRTWNEKYVDN